jgi:predicted dienelactone hydrolase
MNCTSKNLLHASRVAFAGRSLGLYDSLSTAATKLKLPTILKVASSAGIDLTDQSWTGTALLPAETVGDYDVKQI